ncbi:ATP-binding protein [Mariprofundus ferrooxydans]|uniref:histidine kinase n=1 Tax=Mariprofundus ferrooxydans PV-1 TaxID=314345 RepID=Q0F2U9_9PROT|nr:ATP-binding protein [Mariprofundus ferrooxydans]EAU56192.1 multi-sensor hybrid histidine kinase [Mariprofundus ferrooxydans PV-1]KON48045.1 histidine kinase [Mariprofundus ferrooxydans]
MLSKPATSLLRRLIGWTVVIALSGFLISRLNPDWRWEQVPFHSLIEGVGGFVALVVAYLLLKSPVLSRSLPEYIWVACALVGMGTLDLFHAGLYPGRQFIWFHSLSNFVGGLLFALVWLPARFSNIAVTIRLPLVVFCGAAAIAIFTLSLPQALPAMKDSVDFSDIARFLNVTGGVGFIVAAIHFMRVATSNTFRFAPVLANHCLLFGLSGLLFEFSVLWDAVWWEWHLLRLAAYGFILYFFYLSYICERNRYEGELRKLSQAVEANGEGVMITDMNGTIEYVNPAFTDITGYSVAELIGNNPRLLKSDAQDPKFYEQLWSTISSGRMWNGLLIDRKKDGSFYPARIAISPITGESGEITHYVAMQSDMTEYRKLEDQFRQAQKMESLGTLVGGIAHDFNNMLAAIDGNLFLASRYVEDPVALQDRLSNIQQLSGKAANMVQQLLTYARKDVVRMQPVSLRDVLQSGSKLADSLIPDNIVYDFQVCTEELVVNADATQLQQLFINLINNACHAVSRVAEPKLVCSLESVTADEVWLSKHPNLQTRQLAHFSIEDNGCGISRSNLDKIIEPFFTTKSAGEGTGLGLSMVYGSVQRHGGVFEVESEQGAGSTFHVYLPLMAVPVSGQGEDEAAVLSDVCGNGELILLVDDQEELLETNAYVLESMNYRVLTARNGEEALQCYCREKDRIALVLTDIVMPKMSGVKLMEAIWEMDNRVPAILVSGYDKLNDPLPMGQQARVRVIGKTNMVMELGGVIHILLADGKYDKPL